MNIYNTHFFHFNTFIYANVLIYINRTTYIYINLFIIRYNNRLIAINF